MGLKKASSFVACISVAIMLSGCTTMHTPAGNISDVRETDFSKKMKSGEDCAYYVLGLIGPFGDSSLVEAAKDAKISKVEVIDYKDGYYLFFTKHCVVAHGS